MHLKIHRGYCIVSIKGQTHARMHGPRVRDYDVAILKYIQNNDDRDQLSLASKYVDSCKSKIQLFSVIVI